jgi:hypothetical protein
LLGLSLVFGLFDGDRLGLADGNLLGLLLVDALVGLIDGDLDEGARLGEAVNDLVGCVVDGWDVGVSVVGEIEGDLDDGARLGEIVGDFVGGIVDGCDVGTFVVGVSGGASME